MSFGAYCPKCRTPQEKTGKEHRGPMTRDAFGTGQHQQIELEWKCPSCGHVEWMVAGSGEVPPKPGS